MRLPRCSCYLWTLAVVTLGVLGIVFTVNSCFDPTADFFFLTGLNPHSIYQIDNYADVKFKRGLVKSLPSGSIDAAIFGSSRALRINPESPGLKQFGSATYNLAVQGARLASINQFVRLTKKKNPGMVAVIGLDFFAFGKDESKPSLYLDVDNPLPSYLDALMRLIDIRTLQAAFAPVSIPSRHHLLLNGRDVITRTPEQVAALPEYLEKFSRKSLKEIKIYDGFEYTSSWIGELRKLREECAPLIFFINPESIWYMSPLQRSELWPVYNKWKQDLAMLGGVVNFSNTKEITCNVDMYFDEHHYLDNAGELILEDVANAWYGRSLHHGEILKVSN